MINMKTFESEMRETFESEGKEGNYKVIVNRTNEHIRLSIHDYKPNKEGLKKSVLIITLVSFPAYRLGIHEFQYSDPNSESKIAINQIIPLTTEEYNTLYKIFSEYLNPNVTMSKLEEIGQLLKKIVNNHSPEVKQSMENESANFLLA